MDKVSRFYWADSPIIFQNHHVLLGHQYIKPFNFTVIQEEIFIHPFDLNERSSKIIMDRDLYNKSRELFAKRGLEILFINTAVAFAIKMIYGA